MSLMEQFANPDTMGSLSFGEKMAGTGITALMGMGITFAILLILWIMIAVLGKIIRGIEGSAQKREAAKAAAAAQAAPAAAAVADAQAPAEGAIATPAADGTPAGDDQVVAVIAAAIAAAEGEEVVSTSNLVIKKIRRMAGPATAWNTAGLGESLESRRIY